MSVKCSEVVNFNISMGYYHLISEMFEEQLKYIRNYKVILNDYFKKVLNLQVNIGSKLGKPPEEFSNAKWLNYSLILKITEQIPKIIQKQIESQKNFMDELDKSLNKIDDFLKDKFNVVKRFQAKYEDASNELIKNYIDIEKLKGSFLSSINKTEEIIAKYYYNKKKIKESKNTKINDIDLKMLNDKNKEYESQKKILMNNTKKYEKEYNNIINSTIKCEDKFIITVNKSIDEIKNVSCDLTEKLKDILLNFFSSIRESFKSPLDFIDNNFTYFKEINEKENINKAMLSTFNNESKLVHILPEKYNLRSLEISNSKESVKKGGSMWFSLGGKNKNIEENFFNNKKNGFVKFEDGFEEMSYFEEDYILYTVRDIFNNFELINHNGLDLNVEIEEEKNRTKNYICKIINKLSNTKLNEENIMEENEKNNLVELLGKHYNRIIFLHKLNDYRALCKFELKEKEYKLLGELFVYIINISKTDNDYHCVEMVIILSKTYYLVKDKKKIFLQNLVIDNKCFKTKDFWEQLLIYSISKEVAKSNKTDKNNHERDTKTKIKNENIIFSQLLSLIDNMFDFGVDGNMIKDIIEPKVLYYKINDNLKDTINDVIDSKIKENNKNKEEEKKRER